MDNKNMVFYKSLTKFFIFSILLIAVFLTNYVFAQEELPDPLGGKTILGLAETIVKWLMQIAVPLTAIMTIWGAILMMTAMGNPQKIKQAQGALTWAVAGLVVIIILEGLFQFGQTTLAEAEGLSDLLNTIQQYLLFIGGPLSIVIFLYGSYLLGTAKPENVKTGKNILIWTSVALAIISIFTVANLINIINQLAK